MGGRDSGRKLLTHLLAYQRLYGDDKHSPASEGVSTGYPPTALGQRWRAAGHAKPLSVPPRCRPTIGPLAVFFTTEIIYVVYCGKKVGRVRGSREVNQQSH